MKAKARYTTSINASPEAVFRYLGDTTYHSLWNPHLKRIAPMGPLAEGSTYKTSSLLFGKRITGTVKVLKLLPSTLLQLTNLTGMLEFNAVYRLSKERQGTEVSCRVVVSTDSKALAFAAPMIDLLARHEIQGDLEALKSAVERGVQPAARRA